MHAEPFPAIPADAETSAEPRRLIGVKEAARVLGGITPREIYNRLAAGDIESVRIGRRRMILVASLDAYVQRLRSTTGAAA